MKKSEILEQLEGLGVQITPSMKRMLKSELEELLMETASTLAEKAEPIIENVIKEASEELDAGPLWVKAAVTSAAIVLLLLLLYVLG